MFLWNQSKESGSKWVMHLFLSKDLKPVKWCLTYVITLTVQHAINWLKNTRDSYSWFPIMKYHFFPQHIALFNLYLLYFDLEVFMLIYLVICPELKLYIPDLFLLTFFKASDKVLFIHFDVWQVLWIPFISCEKWWTEYWSKEDLESLGSRKSVFQVTVFFICQLLHFSGTQFSFAWRGYCTWWVEKN